MANLSPLFAHPAQRKSIRAQLDDTIRALMLEVHDRDGSLALCLGDCQGGSVAFGSGLDEVRAFLSDNPRDVVTLIVENHVAADRVAAGLDQAGLGAFLLAQTLDAPWPTLRQMIARGERLVVFVDDAAGAPATLLPLGSFA